ncbi:notchless protein homolog 1 [Halyomorpha halys]|uniref:notchless protein homolog 1 n=1 Tax=Halyomorpha halys TaxID=286706 RepID=UPI0006D51CA3
MEVETERRVLAKFKSDRGEEVGALYDLAINVNTDQLTYICNNLLEQDESAQYTFYVNEQEIVNTLEGVLDVQKLNTENVVEIIYQQQAVFKVRAVTRCTSSMPGHAEAVISVKFSPNSKHLASGSGDTTVRFWDLTTQTPLFCCKGHNNWVLCIAWSPDSTKFVSGCKDGNIILWDPTTGKQKGPTMKGHKQWITSLVWEPYHLNRDIGILCRTLEGHAHWVNSLSVNTDYVMRLGSSFRPSENVNQNNKEALKKATIERYREVCGTDGEILVSGSDDFTMFMWKPETGKKSFARLTGHQQLINDVKFSPDTRLLASASFDKSIKLWDGKTGKFITTLRGHVQSVYMIAWSADSRLLVSASADSTLKVWTMKTKKLLNDLPGHVDQVFAVDWSADGEKVASGGKDKLLKLWQY